MTATRVNAKAGAAKVACVEVNSVVTGTAAELVPVTDVDARTIGDGVQGPMTRRLREAFHRLVRSEGYPIPKLQEARVG